MRYAQVNSGNKLHLVCEPGESWRGGEIVRSGYLGLPICGRKVPNGYRMTIHVPLAHACRRCLRMWRAARSQGERGG